MPWHSYAPARSVHATGACGFRSGGDDHMRSLDGSVVRVRDCPRRIRATTFGPPLSLSSLRRPLLSRPAHIPSALGSQEGRQPSGINRRPSGSSAHLELLAINTQRPLHLSASLSTSIFFFRSASRLALRPKRGAVSAFPSSLHSASLDWGALRRSALFAL